MKVIIWLLVAISLIILANKGVDYVHRKHDERAERIIQEAQEWAFYQGQLRYSEGDIRIKKGSDSVYHWSKSPWNSGKEPIYKP